MKYLFALLLVGCTSAKIPSEVSLECQKMCEPNGGAKNIGVLGLGLSLDAMIDCVCNNGLRKEMSPR